MTTDIEALVERLTQIERMLASTGREEDRQYETVQLGSELTETARRFIREAATTLRTIAGGGTRRWSRKVDCLTMASR